MAAAWLVPGLAAACATSPAISPAAAAQAPCEAIDPSWFPDGEWLLFASDCEGNFELYRMRPDGAELTRLTRTPAAEQAPRSSPDGTLLAFTYQDEGNPPAVRVIRFDGAGVPDPGPMRGSTPSWSPDGGRIAYESNRDGNADIYVMDLGTGREARLTTSPARDVFPAWSPDGRTVAFQTDRGGHYSIHGVAPDGSGAPRPLVELPGDAASPAWTADGGRLALAVRSPGGRTTDIYTVGADGTDLRALTRKDRVDFAPVPSPDGESIVFMARGSGGWSIHLIRADGSGERRLKGAER